MERRSGGGRLGAVGNAIAVVALAGLFAAPYLFSDGGEPSRFLLADLGIAVIVVRRYRGGALRRMGLRIPPSHGGAALVVFFLGWLVTRQLIAGIAARNHIEIVAPWPLFSLSQVLHQEMVLRGLLLSALAPWFRSRAALAMVAGAIFAGAHPFYTWWTDGMLLPIASAATLFLFGAATNLLFLEAGHVAFSFAVHAAWNLARFGSAYLVAGVQASEARTFALFEGSAAALCASGALLLLVLLARRLRSGRTRPPRSPAGAVG